MNKNEEHIQYLADIRLMMEKSTRFLSLSGLSGISAGIFALLGALAAYFILDYDIRYFKPGDYFDDYYQKPISKFIYLLILDGMAVLVLAIGFGLYFSMRKARRAGQQFWNPAAKKMMANLAIPLIAGGIFCLALLHYKIIFLIGPSTLIFYGLALINGSKYTLNEIRYLGISQIVLGFIAIGFPGYTILFWALGFGVLHIGYGAIMYYRYDRQS